MWKFQLPDLDQKTSLKLVITFLFLSQSFNRLKMTQEKVWAVDSLRNNHAKLRHDSISGKWIKYCRDSNLRF